MKKSKSLNEFKQELEQDQASKNRAALLARTEKKEAKEEYVVVAENLEHHTDSLPEAKILAKQVHGKVFWLVEGAWVDEVK